MTMPMRTVPLFRVHHTPRMETNVLEVLRSGAIAAGGYLERFSRAFGDLAGQATVVTTNDMANAMQIALRLAGAGPGDEVLTTAFACMSTNAPIAMVGARPAWVDLDPHTATLDLDALKRACTPRCRALILYHVAGYPGPAAQAQAFCQERGIALIEDCDNALLATVDQRQVGHWGQFAVYCFYPNRQINASEGGALACRRAEDGERALRLRRLGIDLKAFRTPDGEIDPRCDIPEIGWAAPLNNLCSALGLEQIPTVAERVAAARGNARRYGELLAGSERVRPIAPLPGADPSYWGYLVRARDRDALLAALKEAGVGASRLHYLNTRYTGFAAPVPDLPGSRELMDSVLALPCGWWLDPQDVSYVANQIQCARDRVGTC
jgi:dTDP-4-amino-4,6-dideoxygalactose transaminase